MSTRTSRVHWLLSGVHNNAINAIKRRQLGEYGRQWQAAAITLQLQCERCMDRVREQQMTWHAEQSAAAMSNYPS